VVFRGLGCGFFPVWVFCVPIGLSETAKRLGDRSVWFGRLIPGLYEVIQYTLSLSLIIIAPGRGWAVWVVFLPLLEFLLAYCFCVPIWFGCSVPDDYSLHPPLLSLLVSYPVCTRLFHKPSLSRGSRPAVFFSRSGLCSPSPSFFACLSGLAW